MFVSSSTAVAGQNPLSFTVRAGDEVTLPCENVISQDCSSTTWLSNGIPKAKSDRLSLREKCSLVIKNIRRMETLCCVMSAPSPLVRKQVQLVLFDVF
uniref:Uncharacterized protein n=1 Tax=Sander lucioperca TaxID=283035 RepID=A0A8C9XTC7_SANLU